ncbi:MAG: ABC transporter substrate-binding protein, partial [Alphaproteobacteria bacterium]|nr:ABC transporter substrate-binding protein [Alphaproteobacteria bacterium]
MNARQSGTVQHLLRVGRRTALGGGAAVLASRPLQARTRSRQLGVLMGGRAEDPVWQALTGVFVARLRELGWHEGQNLSIDWRWAGGDAARIARYATELVALTLDAIFCQTSPGVLALKRQTSTIPIVFVRVTDPIGQGVVTSLARPGGNLTGFSDYDAPMAGKWLEMLTQLNPPVRRAAVLHNPATAPYARLMLPWLTNAAPSFGITVVPAEVHERSEIDGVMAELAQVNGSGVLVLAHIFASVHRDEVITAAARHRLPAVYADRFFAAAGGLMSYGIEGSDLFRRGAGYVDRVLRGAHPGDLPVQNPTKFELAVNLGTAKALGVTIDPALVAAA